MLEHFVVAIQAVIPLFILILVGVFIRWRKMLDDTELRHVNRMVFTVFFFCMMFYNLYSTDPATAFRPRLILFALGSLSLVAIVSAVIVCRIEPSNRSRGAMIQAIYRSNFVLMGIPMVENIFGPEALAVPSMMIAAIIPFYNIVSVFILETFRGEGTFHLRKTLIGVLKNPMILGGILGALFYFLQIHVPDFVLKPVAQISRCTSPVALIILGASFKLDTLVREKRNLVLVVVSRLLLVPGIVLGAAYWLGFRGLDFVALISIFATPCAVASFVMAQQMDSDAELAGNAVVMTSALSCVTLFCWIVFFRVLGVF